MVIHHWSVGWSQKSTNNIQIHPNYAFIYIYISQISIPIVPWFVGEFPICINIPLNYHWEIISVPRVRVAFCKNMSVGCLCALCRGCVHITEILREPLLRLPLRVGIPSRWPSQFDVPSCWTSLIFHACWVCFLPCAAVIRGPNQTTTIHKFIGSIPLKSHSHIVGEFSLVNTTHDCYPMVNR